ncbi:MAG: hypothetical protein NWF14_09705 [Candidatus Bathyarchaeota archaeon]|nr:hypothetical protein [Candidatus Bathyarchaeota archaeon]
MVNDTLGQLRDQFMPKFDFPLNFTEEFLIWLIRYLAFAIPVVAAFAVVGWVIATLSIGVAVKCSSDMLEGRHPSLKRGFGFALSRISSLLTVGFMWGVLIVLGLILFVVPGIIVAVMFSVAVQTIIIEQSDAYESLRRSRKLVAGRWWKTFAVLFSVLLLVAVTQITGVVIGDIFAGPFSNLRWLVASIIASLAHPIYPIASTCLYYSLRTREKLVEPTVPLQPVVPIPQPEIPPAPIQRAFQPRFCYKCGQTLPSDGLYCPRCGVRVKP